MTRNDIVKEVETLKNRLQTMVSKDEYDEILKVDNRLAKADDLLIDALYYLENALCEMNK